MRFNPGDTAPKSGSYKVVDDTGRVVNHTEVSQGQSLPPTQQSGWHYEID